MSTVDRTRRKGLNLRQKKFILSTKADACGHSGVSITDYLGKTWPGASLAEIVVSQVPFQLLIPWH